MNESINQSINQSQSSPTRRLTPSVLYDLSAIQPTTSQTIAMTDRTSTSSSVVGCEDEAGRNISTRVGDAPAKRSLKPVPKATPSQQSLKRTMELASSSDSSSSGTSSSSKSAKRKKSKREKIPTKNHLVLRAAIEAGRKWELNLEEVHSPTDEEACVCVSILAKHCQKDLFPPSKGIRFFELAREGWKHWKEVDSLMKLNPECGNQTRIDGEWIML
jgi:hypothetical protein